MRKLKTDRLLKGRRPPLFRPKIVTLRDASFDDREFFALVEPGGSNFENVRLDKCAFIACNISPTLDPSKRTVARSVSVHNCTIHGGAIGAMILEDSVINGLKILNGPQIIDGVAFRHVMLRGSIGALFLYPATEVSGPSTADEHRLQAANEIFYASVDWALDITDARFSDVRIIGIPAHLIRRDPADQVLVRRKAVEDQKWRRLDLADTYWPSELDAMLRWNLQEMLLIAPRASKRYKALVSGLRKLKRAGIAEP